MFFIRTTVPISNIILYCFFNHQTLTSLTLTTSLYYKPLISRMKLTELTSIAALLALATATPIDYTPKGGWESIQYPPGTGENLKFYPAPPGGWESVDYSNNYGNKGKWTSTYHVKAIG